MVQHWDAHFVLSRPCWEKKWLGHHHWIIVATELVNFRNTTEKCQTYSLIQSHQQYTLGRLFSKATNFANRLKRKFEETIFTNLHWCLLFSLQMIRARDPTLGLTERYDTFGNLVRLPRNQGKSRKKSLEIRKIKPHVRNHNLSPNSF